MARDLATADERIFGVPELHLAAIADAIKELLHGSLRGFGAPESATVKPRDPFLL